MRKVKDWQSKGTWNSKQLSTDINVRIFDANIKTGMLREKQLLQMGLDDDNIASRTHR